MSKKGQTYKRYDLEFKLKLVRLYNEGEGGLRILAKKYGISNTLIRIWLKKYKNGELTAEKADNRGKRASKTTFLSKEEEWDYLRLENEYLKKKLLAKGESKTFIANLWSSKNLK